MTTAIDTRIQASGAAASGGNAPKAGPRRRLFAKYAFALVGLVSLVLLVNGLLNVWFSYDEARDAAVRLQREKADAAARHIEEFIAEIEKQIGWTTATQWASSPIDQRRFDYGRLQRQVPAITELIQLDSQGHEQLKVSRLAMDVQSSGADYSADPRFTEALAKKVWFGPVYFRKESEPYMTMAVAQSGRNSGVTVAEVNLKLIWDVITAIKISKSGYAYVVDGGGRLIAHPDISRVLRNTDLSALPQVAAARGTAGAEAEPAAIVRNLDGHRVLSASAAIPKLGWLVFVEQPISEALAPLYTTVLNTGLLLVLGLLVAILAGLLLARRMTGPIRELDAGAARIGAGALDHRITVQTGDELEELAKRFNTMAADLQSSYADLEKKVEDRTAELKEALDQQTATAEVLGVINTSPGDLAPVFDAILEKAHTLCGATLGGLVIFDGEEFRPVAIHAEPKFSEYWRQNPVRPPRDGDGPLSELIRGGRLVHLPDVREGDAYRVIPAYRELADRGHIRTLLIVPLRKDGALLGAITSFRQEVRPFTDKQIALLQNFAAQAVIAMENARLITETREALEQQTATAEVLGVINSSPGDLAPVFDAMLEKALHLCEAAFGTLYTYDGELMHAVAVSGASPEYAGYLKRGPHRAGPAGAAGRLIRGEPVVHIADVTLDEGYRSSPLGRAVIELGKVRTVLAVPLRKEATPVGFIIIYRREVRPFTDKQIALLQNFAAQAVIAMENARLITETREALEQQTATAEVLGVINSSPGDLTPVFDAMLEKATSLCGAAFGIMNTFDGERFHTVALHGVPQSLQELLLSTQPQPAPLSGPGRLLRGEDFVRTDDLATTPTYQSGDVRTRALVDLGGVRSYMAVPLTKDGKLLGTIAAYRKEVRQFSDKQIALLQNFAAQAVIAMENARLITETREALEQQTATAEVLGVINSSPGDLAPVFDVMLEKATSLCGAAFGVLWIVDADHVRAAASHEVPAAYRDFLTNIPSSPGPRSGVAQTIRQKSVLHFADAASGEAYRSRDPFAVAAVELGGVRTLLNAPLIKDDNVLGILAIYRKEVRPFSDKQIALLENFAAQAVIAMENARLITETREALEQQTATAEVLQVINSSPGDLAPVFDAMLEKAMRLCEAAFGTLWTYDGERFKSVAQRGIPAPYADYLAHNAPPASAGTGRARILGGERFVHVADLKDEEPYRAGDPHRRVLVDLGGARTGLIVPLRKDDGVIGFVMIYRQQVRLFSDKQIALLQNFAAQAVIAMENARLITETREALEQQTATAEVLQVINSSPGELAPVFDAMLEKAVRLCGATFGGLTRVDGDHFHAVAMHNVPPGFAESMRQPRPIVPGQAHYRLLNGEDVVQVEDVTAEGVYRSGDPSRRALADLGGARTVLWAALRKDNALLGAFVIYRQEVRLFTEKQIALLQNFAAQAVIAMENARLITETREALEQQTATAEVLQVINSSPGDLTPVFDAMLDKATRLCQASFGIMHTYDGERVKAWAAHRVPAALVEWRERNPLVFGPGTAPARMIAGEHLVHTVDLMASEAYQRGDPTRRALVDLGGARSHLIVALRKDSDLLGTIAVYRHEVRPFTEKQIALLQNFAAQAVIAMENARLITETREALEQQTATAEVLQVINSSPGDLAPVFGAMLEKAHRLCGAELGALFTYDGERFWPVAEHNAPAQHDVAAAFRELSRDGFRPGPGNPFARVIEGEPLVHIADIRQLAAQCPDDPGLRMGVEAGLRTFLVVPLRKDEVLLGAMSAIRREVRPFTDKQIALLRNFTAQAVIAMENARLLTETHEALEQQTATAEVLQVINSSPGDLTPVFDAMLEKARALCEAPYGNFMIREGERFHAVSMCSPAPFAEIVRRGFEPRPGSPLGRLVSGERLIHIPDLAEVAPLVPDDPVPRSAVELGGVRTVLMVSLIKDRSLLGAFALWRQEVRPFTDKQIALLQSFASQAVIAMENARLLGELRERTRDLQESLDYQTATSDVLKVISQSGADLAPMLQTLVETAARICDADKAVLQQLRDGLFRIAASFGFPQEWKDYRARNPIVPDRGTPIGRMALERRVVHVEDALTDPEYTELESRRLGEFRTMLAVPLFREGTVIGGLFLARSRVEPFTEKQIALVSTFADQAVIAIENARLFNELRERTAELGRSVEELKMLSEVGQAVSSTLDLRAVLSTVLTASLGVTWANAGAIFRYSRAERAFRLVEAVGWDEALTRTVRELRITETESAMGQAVARRMPVQLTDLAQPSHYPLRDITLAAGFHSALIVPLIGAERTLGAIILMRQEAGEFPPETVRLLQTLASQSVLAIQNARMFREIADKSEQLALASQHKSQFLANMSHELRTPLNAILGYAELLVDGIYGVLPDRPKGVLERIQNNGKHLLALINDVLDLAKIEAGQLSLTLEDYALPEVVRSVITATEPLATSKGLKFTAALQDNMPMGHGDARRVSQVLLNLVGNAIKFTEAGEVEIRASSANGQFELTVRDTGPGIADIDQERIFGEFQQIDNTNTRNKGGTGLGLAISKRMVEIQGGTISVESALGQGSTFRVVLPVHVDEMMEAAE